MQLIEAFLTVPHVLFKGEQKPMKRTWPVEHSQSSWLQLNAALMDDHARRQAKQAEQRKQDEADIERMAYEQG